MPQETTVSHEIAPAGSVLDPGLAVRLGLLEAEILMAQLRVAGFETAPPTPSVCDDLSPLGRRHGS
jgi:hypothetical protein